MQSRLLALVAQISRTSTFRRAKARSSMGRFEDAIADCDKAAAYTSDYVDEGSRIEFFKVGQMMASGDFRAAIVLLDNMAHKLNVSNNFKGRAFGINSAMAKLYL